MRKLISALIVLVSLEGSLAGGAGAAPARDTTTVSGSAIVQTALRYLGYPYTTVGNSPSTGFSCIGFVSYVYQSNGIPLPDDLGGAMAYASPVAFSDLQPGDILFFGNTVWPGLSHTAIYLGGGRFIHAEWYNRGVVISSFTNDPVDYNYWIGHYIGANRPWGVVTTSPSVPVTDPLVSSVARAPAAVSRAAAPTSASAQPALLSGPRASVEVSALNIRVRPSLFGPIRSVATAGTRVVVLKQYQDWAWVQLPNGSFGWVMSTALGAGGGISEGLAPNPVLLSSIRVNGLRVHVRPSESSPVVTSAYRGQHVLVLQGWNSWLWVVMPGGRRGWVSGAYVDLSGRTAAAPRHAKHSGRVHAHRTAQGHRTTGVHAAQARASRSIRAHTASLGAHITAGVRLHSRPGLKAPVLGLAAPGARITVLERWNGWVDARLRGGMTGWIYGAYVRR